MGSTSSFTQGIAVFPWSTLFPWHCPNPFRDAWDNYFSGNPLRVDAVGRYPTVRESHKTPQDLRCAMIKPGKRIGGALSAENGASYSMEIRDPTSDKRLLAYTFSIPDHVFDGPDGTDRWVIRQAMRGLLPDEVRLNPLRGRQSADLGWRLLNIAPQLEIALAEFAASELASSYLDIEKIVAAWKNLQAEVNPLSTHLAGAVLLKGLMVGYFLEDTY